jgi:hypothetical protein
VRRRHHGHGGRLALVHGHAVAHLPLLSGPGPHAVNVRSER